MALARIISHSQEHCRELVMDLLSRGYAVEIVSPDKIPDNFADLELRVDADTANTLTARVTTHTGEHSSFFDFVHHLSAPMGEFVRRPPEAQFEPLAPLPPIDFNAELNSAAEVQIPTQSAELAVSPGIERHWSESPEIVAAPAVEPRAIAAPSVSPSLNAEIVRTLAGTEEVPEKPIRWRPKRGITIILHRSRPKPRTKVKNSKYAGGWFLRVAAGFALVIALSAIPILGIRSGDPVLPSAAADSPKFALTETNAHEMPELPSPTAAAVKNSSSQAGKEELPLSPVSARDQLSSGLAKDQTSLGKINDLAPEAAIVDRDKPAKTASGAHLKKTKRRYSDDTVAQDTVIYLDKKPSPSNQP